MKINRDIYKMAILVTMVGAATLVTKMLLNFDVFDWINGSTLKSPEMGMLLYFIVGISVAIVIIEGSFYDEMDSGSFMPVNLLSSKNNSDDIEGEYISIKVNEPKALKVAYWAADPDSNLQDSNMEDNMKDAFVNLKNTGVINLQGGEGEIKVKCPKRYKGEWFGFMPYTVSRHINYRYAYPDGTLSSIRRISVEGSC